MLHEELQILHEELQMQQGATDTVRSYRHCEELQMLQEELQISHEDLQILYQELQTPLRSYRYSKLQIL